MELGNTTPAIGKEIYSASSLAQDSIYDLVEIMQREDRLKLVAEQYGRAVGHFDIGGVLTYRFCQERFRNLFILDLDKSNLIGISVLDVKDSSFIEWLFLESSRTTDDLQLHHTCFVFTNSVVDVIWAGLGGPRWIADQGLAVPP